MTLQTPYTVIFGGKTGVGKSSTQKALWNLKWASDDAVACTLYPQFASINRTEFPYLPYCEVRVVDMPGIGESIETDERYFPYYQEWLANANTLVWITQADTRAYKRDEIFLTSLQPLFRHDLRFVIAVNKVDYLGVDEGEQTFDSNLGSPSEAQLRLLCEKVEDIFTVFRPLIGESVSFQLDQIVPYSAVYKWG